MKAPVIIGGYGTFGSHVARDLARRGVPVVIAGRNRDAAAAFARELGEGHSAAAVDVTQLDSCRAALAGGPIAVNCAGPFNVLGPALLEACLVEGCHYVDIADDRRYAGLVRSYHDRFAERRLAAVYGCSSLPGISGALAQHAARDETEQPVRARVTLFIGNNNPKGEAAVRSLLAGLGQPIAAPQGLLHGFREREVVPLPSPFGRRGVFSFESPEYDLFPKLLGVQSVAVKVGFELRLATYSLASLAFLGWKFGARTARLLSVSGSLFRLLGCSGGAVMSELFYADGSTRRAALVGRRDGQRMAALPAAIVTRALLESAPATLGVSTAYECLGHARLIDGLVAEGFELHSHNE